MADFTNPRILRWNAPTTDVDNNPIDPSSLNYTLLVDGTETVSFPGVLNNGSYEHPLDNSQFNKNQDYTISLIAFFTDEPEAKSAPSNALIVDFVTPVPQPPQNFIVV